MEEVAIKSIKTKDRLGDWSGDPMAVIVLGTIVNYAGKKRRGFLVCVCVCVCVCEICERNLGWSSKCWMGKNKVWEPGKPTVKQEEDYESFPLLGYYAA